MIFKNSNWMARRVSYSNDFWIQKNRCHKQSVRLHGSSRNTCMHFSADMRLAWSISKQHHILESPGKPLFSGPNLTRPWSCFEEAFLLKIISFIWNLLKRPWVELSYLIKSVSYWKLSKSSNEPWAAKLGLVWHFIISSA